MNLYEEALNIREKLIPYVDLEGTELQDTCETLISLVRCIDYVSEEFYQALVIELKEQLNFFKTRTKIVTKTKKTEQTWKELEWLGIDYD